MDSSAILQSGEYEVTKECALHDAATILSDKSEIDKKLRCSYRSIDGGCETRLLLHPTGAWEYFLIMGQAVIDSKTDFEEHMKALLKKQRFRNSSSISFNVNTIVSAFLCQYFASEDPTAATVAGILRENMIAILVYARKPFRHIAQSVVSNPSDISSFEVTPENLGQLYNAAAEVLPDPFKDEMDPFTEKYYLPRIPGPTGKARRRKLVLPGSIDPTISEDGTTGDASKRKRLKVGTSFAYQHHDNDSHRFAGRS